MHSVNFEDLSSAKETMQYSLNLENIRQNGASDQIHWEKIIQSRRNSLLRRKLLSAKSVPVLTENDKYAVFYRTMTRYFHNNKNNIQGPMALTQAALAQQHGIYASFQGIKEPIPNLYGPMTMPEDMWR